MTPRHTVMLLAAQALSAASLVAATRHEAADLLMRAGAVRHAVAVEREMAG